MFIKLLFFIIGALLIIRGCFWFREQNIQPEYDDDQQISEPIYDCIVLFFLDATGYRYISNQIKDPVFQTLNEIDRMIQKYPNNTFLVKTKAIPPSTDYTILSIITGVKQMWNYLDVIFKKQPDKREDSLLKRNLKTALLSSKKIDWIKMTTGTFDFIGNSRLFTLDNIEQADYSTYDLFRKIYSQNEYQLIINHFMGYDALGHALQYQSFKQGINLFELYNNAIKDITKNLRQNDLLIIIGDHDQSKKGKHYQCTEESKECDGFIFAYSKKQRKQWAIYDHYESADLSATILALLGQKPTLQNMGKIIPQFFPSDTPSTRIKDFQKITKRLMIRQLYHQGFRQKYINQLEKYKEDDIFPIIQQNYYLGNIDILFVMLGIILLLFSFKFYFDSYFILLLYFLTNLHYYFFEILFPIIILYYRQQQLKGSLIRFLILIGCVCLNQIYQTPKEINFLLLLVSKRIFLQKLNLKPPNKQILMEFMALISQILVYCFYVFKSIQSEIVYTLLGIVIIFCFINPKVFNKDKTKLLYILIIFIFADIQSCFQFNENQLFVQQILYFALLNPQNSEEVIIFAQVLHRYLNPIYIKDNQGQGLQINMNSMMILVQDFQVGPSLFSMIYGTFGMLIVSRFILLISKQKVSQEFIFGRVFGGLVINIIALIFFYHDLTANIEDQVQSLFMIPKLIMELVIYLF